MKYELITGNYLIELLRAALYKEIPANPPENCSWVSVYELAKKHSVAGMVCYAVLRLPQNLLPAEEVLKKWVQTMQFSIARESIQHIEGTAFFNLLETNKIPFLPLKGWHIKHLYPQPDMRTMCDIDILIHKKDREASAELLRQCGFEISEKTISNHVCFLKKPHTSLELHDSLFMKNHSFYEYFRDYLSKCHSAEGKKYEQAAKTEDFFLFMIAHIAKHYEHGGTGIRSLIDLCLFIQEYEDKMDMKYIESGLTELGLLKFTDRIKQLSLCWFSPKPDNLTTELTTMGNYILSSGTYGQKSVEILLSLTEKSSGNKVKYLIKRCFPSFHFMGMQYPLLVKLPFLIPFFWIIRGFRSLTVNRHKLADEMKTLKQIERKDIKNARQIKERSGLKR